MHIFPRHFRLHIKIILKKPYAQLGNEFIVKDHFRFLDKMYSRYKKNIASLSYPLPLLHLWNNMGYCLFGYITLHQNGSCTKILSVMYNKIDQN